MEQTEAESSNIYIMCSKFEMKFINDDEHIKNDFGQNRLQERYKNCVKRKKQNAEKNKKWRAEIQEDFEKQI